MANGTIDVKEGQELPELKTGPVRGDSLMIMADMLQDPNPIHWNLEYAKSRGLKEVIQQGTLNMVPFYSLLERWCGDSMYIKEVKCRFLGNVFKGDIVTTYGTVRSVVKGGVSTEIHVGMHQKNESGERTSEGTAIISIFR